MQKKMMKILSCLVVVGILMSVVPAVVAEDASDRSNEIPDDYIQSSGTVSHGYVATLGTATEIKDKGSHIDYAVPYLKQLDYPNINESACAPTSLTMLLQYYYPNSEIDVPEVYHSGIQGYSYHGPAKGYKDVSFQPPNRGLEIVDDEFQKYYTGTYSGLRSPDAAAHYLNWIWGGESYGGNALFSDVVNKIRERPLILNIRYNNNPSYGHYIVLRGYDDAGTPDDYSDDIFYVNDPYTKWAGHPDGENREFDYATLSSWYKGRIITFEPSISEPQRRYTTVIDNNHVQLDDINAKVSGNYVWWEYYGPGDWYYPNEDGHWAMWTPNLPVDGVYEVHAIFNDNVIGNDIKYEIYYPDNPKLPIGTKSVKQVNAGWTDENLGTFYLKKGSYVKINNIPSQSNVDAVRFEYISPASLSLDLIFAIDTTGSMWDDIAYVKTSASAIADEILSDIPTARIAVVDYRDFPVDPYGGAGDYPFNDVLPFSTDKSTIVAAIQGLTLGWGADWRESVYSALMHSIDSTSLGGWRGSDQAAKVIILLGDAPPHDPEPFTGYTLSSVSTAAELADPVIIYPIQIGGTVEKFEELADQTGGKAFTAENAGEVVDAILEAIGEIKTKPVAVANGPYSGYVGNPITFDGTGSYDLDGMIVSYEWDFGDGNITSIAYPIITHSYSSAGNYTVTLTVTDNDGATGTDWTTVNVVTTEMIPATIRIEPETMNLASHGVFTAFIQLLEGYDVTDINVSTVVCEGAPAIRGMATEEDNGTYIAKFNRQDLVNVTTGDAVTLTVTGEHYDHTLFEGSDTIRVIDKGKGK